MLHVSCCTFVLLLLLFCASFFPFFSVHASLPPSNSFPQNPLFLSFWDLRSALFSREKATCRGWVLETVVDGVAPQEKKVNPFFFCVAREKRFRSHPDKPNQRKVSSWTFRGGKPEQKFDVNRACFFPKKKHQNTKMGETIHDFFFSFWPFLWFWFAGATPERWEDKGPSVSPMAVEIVLGDALPFKGSSPTIPAPLPWHKNLGRHVCRTKLPLKNF